MKPIKHINIAGALAVAVLSTIDASAASLPADTPKFQSQERLLGQHEANVSRLTLHEEQHLNPALDIPKRVGFYTGKPYDSETVSYTFKYRNYSTNSMRWTTVDPSGFPDGPNNSIYVNNLVQWAVDPGGVDIYHLNDPGAASGGGHSAALVGNSSSGYDYHSFASASGGLAGAGAYTTQHFSDYSGAMDFAQSQGFTYTREQHWDTSESMDNAARDAAGEWGTADYNLTNANCWDMVASMLEAAEVNFVDRTSIPNRNFLDNNYLADGNSSLE